MHNYYVYILASKRNGTLYIGVTNKLVYYLQTENIESALQEEKRLKNWKREWKIALIEKENPLWRDLCDDL